MLEINKTTNKKSIDDYNIDIEKFWKRVKRGNINDCWEWQGSCNTGGYGVVSVKNSPEQYEITGRTYSQVLAHRVALMLEKGLKKEDYALHNCDNAKCCNPNHLRIGTSTDNIKDAIEKGRHHGTKKMWVFGTIDSPKIK